jgi:hypothetical protein
MQFFVIAALIAAATANPAVNTGSSAVSRSDDGLGNFAFGYNEDHATGGSFRKEQSTHGGVVGSYGLRDADGRVRTVNYVADALGYRASISTNEPGTDVKQDPAAADYNLGGHAVVAAPAVLAAPVAAYGGHVAAYGAPVAAYAAPMASYSVATQHVSAGPVLAAPVAAYAKGFAAPVVGPGVYGKGYGHY